MSTTTGRARRPRGFWTVGVYYAVLAIALIGLARVSPLVEGAFSLERLRDLAGTSGDVFVTQTPQGLAPGTSARGWYGAAVTAISMLGALGLMIPVAWVYMITKQRRGYDESVVQALLILPITVAGIVLIVQNSIALAFSLAGIVAAVRFRTTLEDTKDAVYVFLAIGVGLASGVQALGVASVLSLTFNVVILVLWRTNFGNIYADQLTGALAYGDVLAGPGSGDSLVAIGDPQLRDALTAEKLEEVAARVSRMDRYIRAQANKEKTQRLDSVLIVHAAQVVGAQATVERFLDEMAVAWELAEIIPGSGTTFVVEYLLRLDATLRPAQLLEAIIGANKTDVIGLEFRSLKGLLKR